jgi:nickel superoxide dismutase
MTRCLPPLAALLLLLVGAPPRPAEAHCEVPCGIYDDQMRFEMMLEDFTTIKKAMGGIRDLAGKTAPLDLNQLVRWVNTKESHAEKTQEVIARYFMAQRIKPTDEKYLERLATAHAVIQAAMKCKQSVADADADALKKAILDFHLAYEGKPKAEGDAAGHGHEHK